MNESTKTLLFVAAAAVAIIAGFVVGPGGDDFDVQQLVGEKINNFDPISATRLQITKFDTDTAETREFEVAQEDGLWVLPSKQGYPADANQRMAKAANALIDREILRVASETAADHADLGVINPSSSGLDSKATGVGMRVAMYDNGGQTLSDMIIGNKDTDNEGQYYVRFTDQDAVYVVGLDPEPLSTRFEDWIEKDLLGLNTFDILRVRINDYSAELQPRLTNAGITFQVLWDRRSDMTFRYDNDASKWLPEDLRVFDPEAKDYVELTLADDEELNSTALNELKNGLDDLQIVDVERKPDGLSADLKAGEGFLNNEESVSDLVMKGFAPVPLTPDGDPEILSSEGEVICTLKTGVEYVLRFGKLQLSEGEAKAEHEKQAGEDIESDSGLNRYLFVLARFNDSVIEKPQLEDLPELPPDMKASDEGEQPAEADQAETETEAETPEAEAAEEPAAEEPAAEEPTDEPQPTEAAEGDEPEADQDSKGEEDPDLEDIIRRRKAIEQENQRKLDEYQEKIEAGEKTVQELNERFGDWYYLVSDDVYKQIRLGRDQVIQKKEAEAEEGDTAETPAGATGLPNLPVGE